MEEKNSEFRHGIVNFERRKYPRFTIDLRIDYQPIDAFLTQTGQAANLSEGGVLIFVTEKLEVDQRLRIRLFLTGGSQPSMIEFTGEVAWIDLHLREAWIEYRCGIRFTDISPADILKLKTFLQTYLK